MILIADSGSTKTDWCLLNSNAVLVRTQSIGFNPFYQTSDFIESAIRQEVLPSLRGTVEQVFFYGAGCANETASLPVTSALHSLFPHAQVTVKSDMLGAAHALCGKSEGIACILGTGANNAYYNGSTIVHQIGSLGFWLGDEGSGGYLGKTLVRAYLLNELPPHLQTAFQETYPEINRLEVLDRAYKQPFPNRYFASFSRFIGEYKQDPYFIALVHNAFNTFVTLYVAKHPTAATVPVSFVGSIAWHFQDILKSVLDEHQLQVGTIAQSPMEGLIAYHQH
jgi:N-acetylglucosamine kinase-like BadF-type ATPase